MFSQLIIDRSENIFEIDKKNILFKINDNYINDISINTSSNHFKLLSVCEIIVKNLTSDYITLRIQTTKKKYYSANPTYCIINPNENKPIDILYINKEEKENNSKKNKFKFEGFIIKKEEKDKTPKDIFSNYKNNNQKVKGTIIKKIIEFKEDNNYIIPKKYNITKRRNKNGEKENHIRINSDDQYLKKLHNLKNEYSKLKILINDLKINYNNKKKELELVQKSNDYYYIDNILKEIIQKIFPNNIIITIFIISILIGFYLTK